VAYKDVSRQREAERRWYRENRERVFARKNRKKAELRALARRAKQRPCADCGVAYPYYVMDFDHVEGEKSMSISDLVNSVGRPGSWRSSPSATSCARTAIGRGRGNGFSAAARMTGRRAPPSRMQIR
jgi:hypothetical protein